MVPAYLFIATLTKQKNKSTWVSKVTSSTSFLIITKALLFSLWQWSTQKINFVVFYKRLQNIMQLSKRNYLVCEGDFSDIFSSQSHIYACVQQYFYLDLFTLYSCYIHTAFPWQYLNFSISLVTPKTATYTAQSSPSSLLLSSPFHRWTNTNLENRHCVKSGSQLSEQAGSKTSLSLWTCSLPWGEDIHSETQKPVPHQCYF